MNGEKSFKKRVKLNLKMRSARAEETKKVNSWKIKRIKDYGEIL